MAGAVDRDLALHQPLGAFPCGFHHVVEFGQHLRQRMIQRLRFGLANQLFRRTIENADAAGGIDADDAGTRRRQYRFDEAAAAVDQVTGVHQLVALGAQFLRHLVEGFAELRQVASRALHRNLDMQIAGRDDIGRAHQAPYRGNQPVGEVQPDQHRSHQDGQRDDGKHQRERHLHGQTARFDFGVFGDAGLGLVELRDHMGIEQPRHVEEGIVERAQPDHGRHVVLGEYRDFGLGFLDMVQNVRRRRREVQLNAGFRLLQHIAILVDQHGGRQVACDGARGQKLAKRLAILIVERSCMRDIIGHSQDVATDKLGVLERIGAGNGQRVLDRFAGRT